MTGKPATGQSAAGREPRYDELPELPGTDIRHAWEVWDDRKLGTLNRLTPERRLAALAQVVEGECIDLTLPLDQPDPPLYGRPRFEHRVHALHPSMIDDEFVHLNPQASSQWDALRHFGAGRNGFFGGVEAWDSPPAVELGIHTWLTVGVVTRGVLLDLPRFWQASGQAVDAFEERAITVDELQATADLMGARPGPGDVILLRTGWVDQMRRDGFPAEHLAMPVGVGLHAGPEMARYLWDAGVFAVAADNPAVEVLPGDPAVGSLHRRCLAGLGLPFGELWDLEGLAAWSVRSQRATCCVVSVPLHVPGGVASPANAMALV